MRKIQALLQLLSQGAEDKLTLLWASQTFTESFEMDVHPVGDVFQCKIFKVFRYEENNRKNLRLKVTLSLQNIITHLAKSRTEGTVSEIYELTNERNSQFLRDIPGSPSKRVVTFKISVTTVP